MKNLTPITRKEMFMAKAAGQEVTTPDPITREEMFLSDIAEHEEGQGGGGSSFKVTFSTEDDGETWSSDKTVAQIIAAFENGDYVYAVYSGNIYNLIFAGTMPNGSFAIFTQSTFFISEGNVVIMNYCEYAVSADSVVYTNIYKEVKTDIA